MHKFCYAGFNTGQRMMILAFKQIFCVSRVTYVTQALLNWAILQLNKPRLHLCKDVLRKSSKVINTTIIILLLLLIMLLTSCKTTKSDDQSLKNFEDLDKIQTDPELKESEQAVKRILNNSTIDKLKIGSKSKNKLYGDIKKLNKFIENEDFKGILKMPEPSIKNLCIKTKETIEVLAKVLCLGVIKGGKDIVKKYIKIIDKYGDEDLVSEIFLYKVSLKGEPRVNLKDRINLLGNKYGISVNQIVRKYLKKINPPKTIVEKLKKKVKSVFKWDNLSIKKWWSGSSKFRYKNNEAGIIYTAVVITLTVIIEFYIKKAISRAQKKIGNPIALITSIFV